MHLKKSYYLIFIILVIISGCEGEEGPAGIGLNSLINITDEPIGNNCENGGVKIASGIDSNDNGILDTSEISSTSFVCNGIDGKNSLTTVISEPPGSNCENGGIKVESGIDFNENGTLDELEISSTTYVCNGNDGNSSLTIVTSEPAGTNCENGGVKIESGIDSNDNGILDESEISSTTYVCNGTDGNSSITTITEEPAGNNCENGGTKIESGIDLNNNGILDVEEVLSTNFICNDFVSGSYQIINSFGTQGTNAGEFLFNEHISVDSSDDIYVIDTNGNKIEKFGNDGTYLNRFQTINSPRGIHLFDDGRFILTRSAANQISVLDTNGEILSEWGSSGGGDGQFFFFRQIAVDIDEDIYVVDHNNHRVQKFDVSGNFITKWGLNGVNNGEFENPWGIAVSDNNVLVSDINGIQVFDLSGGFIRKIAIPNVTSYYDIAVNGNNIFIACGSVIVRTNINFDVFEYINDGGFTGATGIAVDSNNKIIVSDTFQRTVTVLQKN